MNSKVSLMLSSEVIVSKVIPVATESVSVFTVDTISAVNLYGYTDDVIKSYFVSGGVYEKS